MDFLVTITGGITLKDIGFFRNVPVYIFIAGRSIRDAVNPKLAAKEFQSEISKYWT
jgi:3-dehydro-L-gulonate-6-phosphate decarboxylase